MSTLRSIHTIDCQYLRPRYAASYLVTEGDRALFVDNNTSHSVPLLLEALRGRGLRPEQVEYVVITHVHLDHAGGTSKLMEACPRATLLAHPRAARHMIDPSKLVASARHVYGDEAFEKLYGEILPVQAERVRAVEDGEEIPFGEGAPLRFLHTRGHANHHFCVHEPGTGSIFTGDSFGLAYPALQRAGIFIFPSTSPTDFDGPEALKAVDRILATGARTAYPTHFGPVTELGEAAAQLREWIGFSDRLLAEAASSPLEDGALDRFCEERVRARMAEAAEARGLALGAGDWELLRLDLELNAQGLAHVARKRRSPTQK